MLHQKKRPVSIRGEVSVASPPQLEEAHLECRVQVHVCQAALLAKDEGGFVTHHLAQHLPLLLLQLPVRVGLDPYEWMSEIRRSRR